MQWPVCFRRGQKTVAVTDTEPLPVETTPPTGASATEVQGPSGDNVAQVGDQVLVGGIACDPTALPAAATATRGVHFLTDLFRRVLTWSWVQGTVAHDAADTGNPVGIGGIASDTAPTDVTALDRVRAWFKLNGAQAFFNAYAHNPTDDVFSGLERQISISPVLTITATPDYASGEVVSGIVSFPTVNYASGKGVVLDKLVLCENSGQAPALRIIFFKATPSGGTYTDKSALVWGAGDLANVVGGYSIATGDWVVTASKSEVTAKDLNLPMAVAATTLFALIIAKGAYNPGATGDLLLTATFKQRF